MSISHKALALSRVMLDNLTLRLASSGLAIAQSYDSSGNPVISVGPGTAGGQNAVVRIIAYPSIGTNSLGIAQDSYTPHVIQIATEASATAGVDIMTEANKLPILGESLRTGCKVELYQSANLTAPSTATMVAANLVASYDSLNQALLGTV